MKRKFLVIALVVCLVTSIVLTYNLWGYGAVKVEAYSLSPNEDGGQQRSPISVAVFYQGRRIGESYDSISLPVGRHTLAFGDYSSDYECPTDIEVNVQLFQTSAIKVEYCAKWGILKVTTSKYDAYNEIESFANATIFVDSEPRGSNEIVIRYDFLYLGQHTVSFGSIEGYTVPSDKLVQVEKSKATVIKEKYQKILTTEQQHYVWLRNYARRDAVLDPNSNVVIDSFYQWVLENRVNIPLCYFYLLAHSSSDYDAQAKFYIAQYAGVLLDERIHALDTIYTGLKSKGLDLEQATGALLWISPYHYQGKGEYIVTVRLDFDMKAEFVEKSAAGRIFEFDKNDTNGLPNLFPNIIPAGIAIHFPNVVGVYVKIGDSTRPLQSVYTSFKNFSNLGENDLGGYYDAYKGLSINKIVEFYFSDSISQILKLIEATVMGTVLLDPAGFYGNLVWQRV